MSVYSRVLDDLPVSRFHWRLLLVSGLGWMFDAADILVVGAVVAAVARDWQLDSVQAQFINSANVAGLFFGALLAGWLADRMGRKAVFQITLLVYSVFTGLSALAGSVAVLMLLRFLAGFGLGGELPVASTIVSEFAPAKRRGTIVVLLESFWAYGSVLAALIGYLVIPNFGWRAALLIGALPAFYIFILRRHLPESPRFLASKGRHEEAAAVVQAVAKESGVDVPAENLSPDVQVKAAPTQSTRVADLFAPAYLKRTLTLWLMWATMNFSYYGIFLWLPTQFVRKGFSLDQALLYNLIIAVAQIPGYFLAAYLVEKLGRKPTYVIFLTLAGIGAFFFGQVALAATDVTAILIWGSIISFFNLGAWGVVYTYTPELYPTRLRGTGAGWAAAVGRAFAFLAPLTIAYQLVLFGGDQTVFLVFAAVMVGGALIVAALGPETKGRSLEEVSGT